MNFYDHLTRLLRKTTFSLHRFYIELKTKKFVDNGRQCFAKIKMYLILLLVCVVTEESPIPDRSERCDAVTCGLFTFQRVFIPCTTSTTNAFVAIECFFHVGRSGVLWTQLVCTETVTMKLRPRYVYFCL